MGLGGVSFTDGGASIESDKEPDIIVQSEVGDHLIGAEIPQPTIIKVDVEGAEARVLAGLKNTLREDKCRMVYCEVHEGMGVDVAEIDDMLNSYGYTTQIVESRINEKLLKASR